MAMKLREVYLYDGEVLRCKLTVEERSGQNAARRDMPQEDFIATKWCPDECLEEDRDVEVYDTFSAALAGMFENALNESLQYSNLKMFGKMKKRTA